KINRMLLFKSVDDLYELDLSDDDKHKIIMRLLANISSAAYFAQPLLSPLLIFKMIKLSVINGLTSESAFAFVSYGLMIQGFFNRLDMGYQFGKMALELVDKHNFITEKPKVSMVYSLVNRWREADINTLKLLTEGYQCGLDTGDFWFGGLCGMAYPSNMFIIGHHSLSDNLNALQEYGQNIKKIKQYTSANFTNFYHQITLNLIGASPEAWKLSGPVYDEEIQVARHIAAMDKTMLFSYHTVKMMLCYMFHQYDEALYHGLETEKYMEGGLGLAKLVLYHVYLSLIHLALADNPAVGINKRLKIVKQNQRKVKHWAENSPENYAGFYYLVEAELAKVTRQDLKAMESYDQAIDIFHSHQLLRDEALANELAGRYHFSRQRDHFGRNYIVEARYRYDLWGAQAKVKDLEDIYPELLSRQSLASSLNPETLSSMTEVSSDYGEMQLIDLSTVVKAAESLSSEIVLSKLLSSLMTQAIENSGAQKGCLIVSKNDKWHIIAQVSEKSVIVNSPDQDDSEQDMAVPMNIILYVSRVKTYIIVDQAEQDSRFNIDPYIKKFKPKSILCLPLINKGKLNGILYLENNLNHRVFNSSRVRIMDLLSSLMAISLENATLYSDLTGLNERLENMVEERTHKLRQSEEKYKALFLYNPDIVFSMDLDGVFSSVNPNSEEIAGYTSKEVIGSHFKQLLPKEQIPKIEKKIDEVIKGKPQYFETVILHKNGEKLIMDITAVPIVVEDKVLGVYGIAKDITKRKQIEAALIEQEEEHRLLIELLPDGIVIHRDDKILYINQSAISILAVKSPDEVLGKSVFQFLHPDSRESFNKNIQNIQEEKISDKLLELKLLNDSGKVVETEAALSKIRYRGSQSLITILRDISQRKRLERLKEEVERTMHHDLKSPLLAIMGFSKMLLNREIGTKEKEWIQSIQESSHKMKYLISRSFDLFKMEEGSYLSNPQDINMVNFLKNIKKSFTPMIEIKSLRMDFRLNEERISEMKDYSIRSDENLLDILFNNLLKNALEASPEHSVVSVHIDSAENGYHIDIHNYGMVDDRVSERFFERYVTAGKKDGTGLGTYSAYLVVKTLGGTIRFTSSKSQGTHLLIHLPR
ncbi:MAG: PAS domain S-box protein, partial [Spirochaetota bacterium]|nr:PAS domain S-box protein [Spirochaetota bacterium]